MYSDDRVLVAIMNNHDDWARVQTEGWYRIPAKKAPEIVPNIDILAFYFTAKFGADRYAIHFYADVNGHELVTRQDLFPHQPNHPRAGDWYYKLMLGPLQYRIPPITSNKWRRITFIETTGDRFDNAVEINDLFDKQSPMGELYVKLKEEGFNVEQFWTVQENKATYTVDLAVLSKNTWLPINLTDQDKAPADTLQLSNTASVEANMARVTSALDAEASSSEH